MEISTLQILLLNKHGGGNIQSHKIGWSTSSTFRLAIVSQKVRSDRTAPAGMDRSGK